MFPQETIDDILLRLPVERIDDVRCLLSPYANHLSEYTTFEDAVRNGGRWRHFDWLWERRIEFKKPRDRWPFWFECSVYNWVTYMGNLECLVWLTRLGISGCRIHAMDTAAHQGHLDVEPAFGWQRESEGLAQVASQEPHRGMHDLRHGLGRSTWSGGSTRPSAAGGSTRTARKDA